MSTNPNRLYELLPTIYRQRDAEQGRPLEALLHVIGEQVDVVEADIAQLYENWFIETCEDWVVPYIGDLIGYRAVHEAGMPGEGTTARDLERNKILIPRREVANTIRYRRRKGTLALLELLAESVAGWPARAVEFYTLLGVAQAVNHLRLDRGRTVDLHEGDALDRLDSPFDELAHTVDVRRVASHRTVGWHNIPSVGLFVWRLRSYSVTETPAYCVEEVGPHCYTFSVLGNDTPLYTDPAAETDPTQIAGELNLPVPIRRRAFEDRIDDYYGPEKSLHIWEAVPPRKPVRADRIVVADLSHWTYRPKRGQIAVDPERGRIVFPPSQLPRGGVWVSYHYGFSADIGGGEYDRPLFHPLQYTLYRVGRGEAFERIHDAIRQWKHDLRRDAGAQERLKHAVIEITDSGVYVEQLNVELEQGQTLQIRAANRTRPVIRLLDWQTGHPDALSVTIAPESHFTLDGLLVTGRGIRVRPAPTETPEADESEQEVDASQEDEPQRRPQRGGVHIRHSTLVPGWSLDQHCEPRRPAEPSLELFNVNVCLTIEHSIVGAIQVNQDEVMREPVTIRISDSVLDATSNERVALGAPGWPLAHAVLTVVRSTVFGQIHTHAIDLGENSIFMGKVLVARRQRGCMRFCYVTPGSRTPRRYRCQPDEVRRAAETALKDAAADANRPPPTADEIAGAQAAEAERVRPRCNSVRYSTPAYCQLAATCADEITRGADDESEMGVFHDLYQPQRAANLRARLDEYTPAGADAGIIFAS